jgi:hypothetical protein
MATATEQLEAMRGLPENWDGYGAAAPGSGPIDAAIGFLRQCGARLAVLQPYVAPTRSGGVLLEWEQGPHQLEIQFDDAERGSFVYLNRETGETAHGTVLSNRRTTAAPLAVTAILSALPTATVGA